MLGIAATSDSVLELSEPPLNDAACGEQVNFTALTYAYSTTEASR
jgi:hypothetical protein